VHKARPALEQRCKNHELKDVAKYRRIQPLQQRFPDEYIIVLRQNYNSEDNEFV
jgi:hypothetical protein